MLTFESDPRVLLSSRKIIQSLPTFLAESLVTSNYAFSKFLSNDWVIITTSNQLFVWNFKPKSSSKQPQLSTSCRSFDLPGLTDDEPWVTSRLTCLSFGTATNEPGSNLTPTLLACVSTDGLFRVWQRIHRRNDFIDSDLEIQSHPDEVAHSLEPGPLPGTFLLATTFGRVFGIDARFPQAGISARLIPPPGDTEDEPFSTSQPLRRETANSSLLSGLSRRVSSILSYASSRVTTTLSGGVNEKRQCELVRFTTRQLSSEEDNRPGHFSCLAAIMFRHRLDVWRVLEDFSPVALLKLDFASDLPLFNSLRQPSAAVVPLDLTFSSAYVLQPRPAPALHLLLRSIDAESQMPCLFLVTLVNDEPKNVDQWVYAESATVVLEGEESVEQEDTDLRLVFPDPAARSTYPCLLAAVHWLRKNSACVFEAATGRSVVHVTVNSRTNATTANELIAVQSCNQKSTLFAFITRQSGVHCLLADPSVAASCCGELKGPDTSLRTLDVECSITENPSADPTYDFFSRAAIVFWLGYEQEAERRVRRFFGSNSIHRLSSRAPAGGTTVAEAFLHLARRVIDSRPSGDPRWRSTGFTSSAPAHLDDTASSLGSNATLGPLESTDETAFDFARPQAFPTGLVTEDQEAEHHALSPLAARFAAKHLGLKRLALFWRLADEYASPSSLPLSSLALLLVPGEEAEMSAEGQEEEATKLGGRSLYSRRRFTVWKDEEDDDPLYMVQESSGSHLNWDPPHLTEAELEILNSATVAQLEQALGEGADSCGPTTHVLNAFLVADELVEFVRTLHSRLRRVKNQQLLHQVFSKVVQGSGFLEPDLLCNLSPQDIFWQSISLAPRLIITLSAQLRADLEETQESLESLPPGQDPAGLLAPLRTAAQLLTTSLSAAVTHRAKFLPTLRSSLRSSSRGYADHDHELPCWITDAFPFGVGDSLLNLFDLLVRWGSPKIGMDSPEREEKSVDAVLPSGDTECACQAVELASILLRAAHQRVTWMRRQQAQVAGDGNSSAAFRALVRRRRLEVWFARLRSRLISDIAYRLKRPESALSLAEKFLDREQIVSLCDLLDRNLQEDGPAGTCFLDTTGCTTSLRRHDNLARLLTLLPTDLQLANYALQWHYERGEKARVQSLLALLQKLEAAGPTTERREIEEEEEEEATEPSLKRPRHPSRDEDSALFQTRKSTPASRLATSRRPCRSPMAPTGDLVTRFLSSAETRDYAWLHHLGRGAFLQAAQDLYSAGLAEGELLGRRRTLLSLSKLAQIAGDAENVQKRRMLAATDASDRPRNRRYFGDDLNSFPSPRTAVESLVKPSENGVNTHLETIDLQLEAIGYQADLTKSLVPPTGEGDMSCGRVMSLSHVARLYVSGARPLSPEAPAEFTGRPGLLEFCRALRLSELLLLIPTAESQAVLESEHTDLLLYIWSQAIKMDSWKQAESDEDALTMSEGTFFYSLLTHCLLSGSRLSQIFPPIDELLAYGKLSPLSENVWFPFAIKSCYNHAVAKASKSNSLGLVTMPVIS